MQDGLNTNSYYRSPGSQGLEIHGHTAKRLDNDVTKSHKLHKRSGCVFPRLCLGFFFKGNAVIFT
jgi:hypothetical protein